MKVLVLANDDLGLILFRRDLLLAIINQHHSVFISSPAGKNVQEIKKIGCSFYETPIDRRGINPAKDAFLLKKYFSIINQIKPDLVVTYTIKPNIYGGIICRLLGVPYATNITGLGTAFQKKGALRTLVTTMYRMAMKKALVVFFENTGNMETLLTNNIVRQEQCKLLPGAGVNLEHFMLTPYPQENGPVRFLFIGRVMAEKGIDELFEAMERLRQEGVSCYLDVLGVSEEDYEKKIETCTAQGWLHYHGYQKDVRPFIAKAHCFVLPSWHEGMANTNLECAAMGRPLITSRIHGCMEAVIDEVSGLLCEPKNVDSLYSAMYRFCEMTVEQRETMGKIGRQHMENTFDKRNVVTDTLKGLGL